MIKMLLGLTVWIVYIFLTITESKRNLIYGNATADCDHKAPYLVASYGCHLKLQTRRIYGYGNIMFKRRIEAMGLQIIIVRNDLVLGDINVINMPMDLCDFLTTTHKHKYLSFLIKPLRKYVNEIPRCPLKENFNYTLSDAFLDAENVPDFIPVGNFTFIVNFFDKNIEAGHFKLRSEVKYKEKQRKGLKGKKGLQISG